MLFFNNIKTQHIIISIFLTSMNFSLSYRVYKLKSGWEKWLNETVPKQALFLTWWQKIKNPSS